MNHILDVYLHGIMAGKLSRHGSGQLRFQYSENYLDANNLPAISISLPKQKEAHDNHLVKAYFSGLLPEDIVRHKLARFLGVSEKNAFALLEMIGGECAGALSLYPEGKMPPSDSPNDVEVIDESQLREILTLLKRRPLLAGTDNLRLSLAGAQDKIAVGVKEGQIALVKGTTPTSHILKPLIEGIKDSVHNEIFCMHLAKMLKINVPHSEIRWLDDTPYFLIERYDRIKFKNKVQRLHQEDFCQAMGIMPEFKYEREGGPSVQQCLSLLQQFSQQPAADTLAFIRRLIFNYLIGNADAHGKNFSLIYLDNLPILSPAYDLLSTTVYPDISSKMAMKIGSKYDPKLVFLRHWKQIVPNTTSARKNLEKHLLDLSNECEKNAIELKKTLAHSNIISTIFDDIIDLIQQRAKHLRLELQ